MYHQWTHAYDIPILMGASIILFAIVYWVSNAYHSGNGPK